MNVVDKEKINIKEKTNKKVDKEKTKEKNDIRDVFLSEQNVLYILGIINNKIDNIKGISNIDQIKLNKGDIKQLEGVIFNVYFDEIYNELVFNNKYSPEGIIIILNKIVISEIQNFIQSVGHRPHMVEPMRQKASLDGGLRTSDNNGNSGFLARASTDNNASPNKNYNSKKEKQDLVVNKEDLVVNKKEHDKKNKVINNKEKLSDEKVEIYNVHYFHFFSDDAKRVGTKWTYKLDLENLSSICLQSFRLNCNLYNINEWNNKFELTESNNTQITVTIPPGYYTIDALLNTITNILNEVSPNKMKYSLSRNQQKNKIHFSSFFNSTKLSAKPLLSFNIRFLKSTNTNYSLAEILGFTNVEYSNNSTYISETFPKENIYDDIYVKIRINDIELPRYISTKNTLMNENKFTYFENFSLNMNKNFGKTFSFNRSLQQCDFYDFNTPINANYISFEFFNSPSHILNLDMDFQITTCFETIDSATDLLSDSTINS